MAMLPVSLSPFTQSRMPDQRMMTPTVGGFSYLNLCNQDSLLQAQEARPSGDSRFCKSDNHY